MRCGEQQVIIESGDFGYVRQYTGIYLVEIGAASEGRQGCVALTARRPGGSAMGQRAAMVEGAIQQGWAHLIWIGCEVRTYGLILRTHFKQQYALLAACGQGVRDMHCQRTFQGGSGIIHKG